MTTARASAPGSPTAAGLRSQDSKESRCPLTQTSFQAYLQPPKSVQDYQAAYDQADTRRNALQMPRWT
jgi:hypothetical protein